MLHSEVVHARGNLSSTRPMFTSHQWLWSAQQISASTVASKKNGRYEWVLAQDTHDKWILLCFLSIIVSPKELARSSWVYHDNWNRGHCLIDLWGMQGNLGHHSGSPSGDISRFCSADQAVHDINVSLMEFMDALGLVAKFTAPLISLAVPGLQQSKVLAVSFWALPALCVLFLCYPSHASCLDDTPLTLILGDYILETIRAMSMRWIPRGIEMFQHSRSPLNNDIKFHLSDLLNHLFMGRKAETNPRSMPFAHSLRVDHSCSERRSQWPML